MFEGPFFVRSCHIFWPLRTWAQVAVLCPRLNWAEVEHVTFAKCSCQRKLHHSTLQNCIVAAVSLDCEEMIVETVTASVTLCTPLSVYIAT